MIAFERQPPEERIEYHEKLDKELSAEISSLMKKLTALRKERRTCRNRIYSARLSAANGAAEMKALPRRKEE